MLLRYAAEHGYTVQEVYIDEDYSGADRRRPAFNQMLAAAERREFDVILAKTQSRFTRDMELVEKYLHGKFAEWGIRFIAVVDHVDTQDRAGKKVQGAAVASVAAQVVSCLLVYLFLAVRLRKKQWRLRFTLGFTRPELLTYAKILLPLLASEFLWSLGENVYSAIYGNIGTQACAAMTMTTPIQCLMVGALSGLSKAAAILIGKSLGTQEYDRAYRDAQRLMRCGLAASLVLSALLLVFGRLYTTIYRVEPEVRATAYLLLVVFAVISPVKVQNMILGGGILKSGGKTNYTLAIDLIGTWGFGVPLGFLAAFVLKLPVAPVYFLLSLEECVRLALSLRLFKKRSWMQQL